MLKKLSLLSLHLLMLALVVAIAAYWIVKILTPAPLAAPLAPPAPAQKEVDPVLAARMFGLVQTAAAPGPSNFQLLGVFAAGRSSSAVIAADGKPARVVLLGQPVVAGTRLAAVNRDGVVLDQDGATRELKMPARPQPEPRTPPAPIAFTRDGNMLSAPSKGPPVAAAAFNPVAAAAQPQAAPASPIITAVPPAPPPTPVVAGDLPPSGAAAPVSTAPHPTSGRRARRGRSEDSE